MIAGVGSMAVLVNDARKAAEWYRDKLGFEVVGSVGHTVFVRPEGAETPLIHLCAKCDAWEEDKPGGRTGIWLRCGPVTINSIQRTGQVIPASRPEDVERTYALLKRRGVEFAEELTSTKWGKYAVFKDLDGNEFEIS
jgi:catechol 2,3-dioxygenase-like lactoylglutathione lyase family enzyme